MTKPITDSVASRVLGVVVGCRRDDGRWLLIRRSATVRSPLAVCFPGGTIEPGESQVNAAVREMHEELAAVVTPHYCCWTWHAEDRPLTLFGWRATLQSLDLTPNPAEVAEVLWLTADQARSHPDALPNNPLFMDALEHAAARALAVGG